MRIGIVLAKTPSYSETFFISKIKGLQQCGFKVTLFVQSQDKKFNLCPVKKAPMVFRKNVFFQVVFYGLVMFKLFVRPRTLRLFLTLERQMGRPWKQILKNLYNNAHILTSDLDWVHFGFTVLAIQSEHVAKAIGAKMAVSFRGFDIAIYPIKNHDCYDNLWQHLDKVHTISEDLLSIGYGLGMKPNTPFAKITPAIDLDKFKRKLDHREKVIIDQMNFLTVGRLHWKKGLIDTLEALALLKNEGVDFAFTIVGDGNEFEALSFAIHQLRLSECVTLLGRSNQAEIVKLLNHCDIYIQYSISEGFCNAVLEAQAMGCLCVVSDAEGLAENILHEETGWVVPKRNPQALTDQISDILNMPEYIKDEIKANARTRVKNQFNLVKQRKEFAEFYS